jgi:hypothetical protein
MSAARRDARHREDLVFGREVRILVLVGQRPHQQAASTTDRKHGPDHELQRPDRERHEARAVLHTDALRHDLRQEQDGEREQDREHDDVAAVAAAGLAADEVPERRRTCRVRDRVDRQDRRDRLVDVLAEAHEPRGPERPLLAHHLELALRHRVQHGLEQRTQERRCERDEGDEKEQGHGARGGRA